MAFYQINFAVLVLANSLLALKQHSLNLPIRLEEEVESETKITDGEQAIARFKKEFFSVYLLVFGADWLQVHFSKSPGICGTDRQGQGPHIYALYKYEKGFHETTVAALYAAGFISGAISASFVGSLADRYGRRMACMAYCISYSICCLTMVSNDFLVLLGGRLLGGFSTTLLFSVFETWMITEYHHRRLEASGLSLSSIFGKMTTVSSVVAIVSGVLGDFLVERTASRTSPFFVSVICLVLALGVMLKYWVFISMSHLKDNWAKQFAE